MNGPVAVAYDLVTPRDMIGEFVGAWVQDCNQHGGAIVERNALANCKIAHEWGAPVRQRMDELVVEKNNETYGNIGSKTIRIVSERDVDMRETPADMIRRAPPSPST